MDILFSDKEIDIIVTDINMPRMDGLTLLHEISDINPDTVTTVVSAYGDMPNIHTAMNRGAFDFVTKPINFQDFRLIWGGLVVYRWLYILPLSSLGVIRRRFLNALVLTGSPFRLNERDECEDGEWHQDYRAQKHIIYDGAFGR